MKIFFTNKALREHEYRIMDEMRDKQFMMERLERLEQRLQLLEREADERRWQKETATSDKSCS